MPIADRSPIPFVVGPTAIGKTALALRLARRINGEIISSDSMQIYRGMSVLSQAPTKSERGEIPHHLVCVLSPEKEWSVAAFRIKATLLIASIRRRGKCPIVVGGSGLYAKRLIDGLFPSPEADVTFRARMEKYASRYGSERLHAKLIAIDPEAASRIHRNDIRRVIRALEVYHTTGRTMSELVAETRGLKNIYPVKIYGLTAPREYIYKNIMIRTEKMLAGGAIQEVARLRKRRISKTASGVLGYREIGGYLNGAIDLKSAGELLAMNTRHFAKRQLTWFKADKRIRWFDVTKKSEARIVRLIASELKG